jgi:hypothetical protein
MQYHIEFSDLQRAADTLRTVAHTMKLGNVAPGCRTWSVAYNSDTMKSRCSPPVIPRPWSSFPLAKWCFGPTRGRGVSIPFRPVDEAANALLHDAVTAVRCAVGLSCRSLSQAELEALCPTSRMWRARAGCY